MFGRSSMCNRSRGAYSTNYRPQVSDAALQRPCGTGRFVTRLTMAAKYGDADKHLCRGPEESQLTQLRTIPTSV
jgi:hypothetical protein